MYQDLLGCPNDLQFHEEEISRFCAQCASRFPKISVFGYVCRHIVGERFATELHPVISPEVTL